MVLPFLDVFIQYSLLRVLRFSPAHLVPASPAVPSQSGTAPLPWGSQRLFCPVPAWRNLVGKGWETLHHGAYCTLKYDLAGLGRLLPCWLAPGSKGMIKFLSWFMCRTWKFPSWRVVQAIRLKTWSCVIGTVWLNNVYFSFQSWPWKIDHQRSGSWEWHRWECGDGAWGGLWGAGGETEKLGSEDYSDINDSIAHWSTEGQKEEWSWDKRSAPSLPSLPSLSTSLLKHCCSDLSGRWEICDFSLVSASWWLSPDFASKWELLLLVRYRNTFKPCWRELETLERFFPPKILP